MIVVEQESGQFSDNMAGTDKNGGERRKTLGHLRSTNNIMTNYHQIHFNGFFTQVSLY